MNIEEIKDLLARFDQSTLTEFDLHEGTFSLYMNKNTVSQKSDSGKTGTATPMTEPLVNPIPAAPANDRSREAEATTKTIPNLEAEEAAVIVSPIVGIVYLKPAPDKENFKQVGDFVKKGEVVCIVEAMKLMNEITATEEGTIAEILVSNEDVVEFNQPLFRVSKGV